MSSSAQPVGQALETTTSELEGAALLTVRGELDLATTPGLCREIDCASRERPRIVVDLRAATLYDSSSVRALIGAAQEAAIRTCEVVLVVEPQSAVARLLDASGGRELIRVESTPRHALTALAERPRAARVAALPHAA